jgi:RNA polymerase sigma-70 factor, ECF subfamily
MPATISRTTDGVTVGSAAVSEATVEADLLTRLRAGDERAFEVLVHKHHRTMLAVARQYVSTRAVAEEVVQEAWLGVLKGIDRFEGRSSLGTWILRILVNTAKTRGVREARIVPYAALAGPDDEGSVEPERFRGPGDQYPGGWWAFPEDWTRLPEPALLQRETLKVVADAIELLPPLQRSVITLRDVQGCGAEEACALLELTDGNQRVLLHRARSRVRAALERHFDGA